MGIKYPSILKHPVFQILATSEQFFTKNACQNLRFDGLFFSATDPPKAGASWYRRAVAAGGWGDPSPAVQARTSGRKASPAKLTGGAECQGIRRALILEYVH